MKRVLLLRVLFSACAALSVVYTVPRLRAGLGKTTFDDAYMFLRYAKHWLGGAGFSWNVTDGPAHGITSALHLFLVTALRGLTSLPDAVVLTAVSALAGIAACAALTALAFQFGDGRGLREAWAPLLVVPCVLLGPLFGIHALTGMETTTALLTNALLALALVALARRPSALRLVLTLLAAYATYLARPDNGIYALVLPPLFLIASDRHHLRTAFMYAGALVSLLALDLVLKWTLFGDALPLPLYAKGSGFQRGYTGIEKWNAMAQMLAFAADALPYLLVLVACVSRPMPRPLLAVGLALVLTFAYLGTVTQIMGWNARYYYPSLPFVILAAALAAAGSRTRRDAARSELAGDGGDRGERPIVALRLGVATALVLAATSPAIQNAAAAAWARVAIHPQKALVARTSYPVRATAPLPHLGWWNGIREFSLLLGRAPRPLTIAASEYGLVGSEHPAVEIVDLAGLHDATFAHHGFSAERVFAKEPDLVWMPYPDYTYAVTEILDSGHFAREYEYYPGAYDYGVALRKASPSYAALRSAFEEEFRRIYPGIDPADHRAGASAAADTAGAAGEKR